MEFTPQKIKLFEKRFKRGNPDECWNWTGVVHKFGYAIWGCNGKAHRAHRVSFALYKGKLMPPLVIDHLCRNRRCVNPNHLQQVTRGENTLLGLGPSAENKRKATCIYGHPFVGKNLYIHGPTGARQCRTCLNLRQKETRRRKKLGLGRYAKLAKYPKGDT